MPDRNLLRAALATALVSLCACGAAQAARVPKTRAVAPVATPATPTPALLQKAQDVAIFALSLIGVDYHFGGDNPASGVDCSGLVRYVFSQTTGIALPRTSAQMGSIGARVPRVDLVPGDLVFFNTRHFMHSHVGIYLGDNRFVHAPSAGSEVRIASLDDAYWRKRFDGARRLVGVLRGAPEDIGSPVPVAATLVADHPLSLSDALTHVDMTQ